MKISVVIPVWNGREHLEKNLPNLIKAKKNKSNKIDEIILVDDGSSDDSATFIKKNYKDDVILITNNQNKGFSYTVNEGVRKSKGDLVCVLNQDVNPCPDFLKGITKHFANNLVFAVSLNEQEYGPSAGKFENGFIIHEPQKKSKERVESFWASGGSAVFRKSTWQKLKGFDDEVYKPFYWEDVDLSYRALKRGYKILWDPKAKVTHVHESSINEKNFRKAKLSLTKERNHLLFNWKNITSANIMRKHLKGLANRLIRHPGYIKVVLLALPKLPVIWKRRRIEKRESKLSDEALLSRN